MAKLLVIVGVGEGIGLAVAQRFAAAGFTIAMVARNVSKLEALQAKLEAEGYNASCFVADAGNESALRTALAAIQTQLGAPDVLVYNAAIPKMQNLLHETLDSLTADFKVNVAGALAATQAVLPAMRAAGKGVILLTGGGFAMYPSPDFGSLSIGKAGIRSLSKMLAEALQPDGIRVGTVTITGSVDPNDPKYNPDSIAENYWMLYTNPVPESEIIY